MLLPVAEEAAGGHRSVLAWQALSLAAATVAYRHGADVDVIAVRRMLDRLPVNTVIAFGDLGTSAAESRVGVRACTAEPSERPGVVADLHALPPQTETARRWWGPRPGWWTSRGWRSTCCGSTSRASSHRRSAVPAAPPCRLCSGPASTPAGGTRCSQRPGVPATCRRLRDGDGGSIRRPAAAYVQAFRGVPEEPARLVARALAVADGTDYRSVAARAWHALGTAAAGEGRVHDACRELAQLFDLDGRALHHHVSYLGLADLAGAAVRGEPARRGSLRSRLEPALAVAEVTSPRLRQIAARARGLLDPDAAGEHFAVGLSVPTGDQWPYERALLLLDYGEWLRRCRHIEQGEASPLRRPRDISSARRGTLGPPRRERAPSRGRRRDRRARGPAARTHHTAA